MVERTIQAVIADVRDDTECRKRYGDAPYDDEILVAEIDRLTLALHRAYTAINALYDGPTVNNTFPFLDVIDAARALKKTAPS